MRNVDLTVQAWTSDGVRLKTKITPHRLTVCRKVDRRYPADYCILEADHEGTHKYGIVIEGVLKGTWWHA